jgi:hypothetical protein
MAMFALPLVGNQRGVLQHFQVPGNGGQRNLERFGQFADRRISLRKARDDRPARRVGKGGEGVIEIEASHLTYMLINLLVKSSALCVADPGGRRRFYALGRIARAPAGQALKQSAAIEGSGAKWAPAHSSGNGALFRHFETICDLQQIL